MHNIYLDSAATTPLSPQVKQYIIELLDEFYNPSSLYQCGIDARQIIEQSRYNVAKFINAEPRNIIFTSGGSASNTLAIKGFVNKNPNYTVLYSPIAHKSILKCVNSINGSQPLRVDEQGFIDLSKLEYQISLGTNKKILVIDYANSEIGTIQNIKKLIMLAKLYHAIIYLDCTGLISQIPVNVKELDVDMLGFSAHKLGSLKGCGVLYKKSNIELEPLIYGSQEQSLFGGTENMLGIASLGKAIENYNYSSISSENRNYVYDYIIREIPNSYLVGAPFEHRLPHNLYMCFKGIQGESLMILLDMNGIQISTGSACTSGDIHPSSTLTAIGMNKEDINSCVRLSFSGNETKQELDYVCTKLKECINQLRQFN